MVEKKVSVEKQVSGPIITYFSLPFRSRYNRLVR